MALRKNAIPKERKYNSTTIGRMRIFDHRGETPFNKAKTITTTKLIPKLINAPIDDEMTTICLEKCIFRSRSPWPTTDIIPPVVVSLKKFHRMIPSSSPTEKWGTSAPKRRKRTNTRYMIVKSNSGLSTDHMYPRNDC
ncbi:hypothetical protein BMIN_1508 [Bifidobacterium minimum]|uniref:Uncharacterized protein n=1 Tax=Bifidobacterium minimum TaxID=1693 RepID=A0A087BLE2_9BIFI|nr:hypothetical protein BMIN_1508 [Bifidobacterium minimum]